MSKVALTFEDHDGQVGLIVDLGEPFNQDSNAHKTANMVLNWLDSIHQTIQTGEELEARRTDDTPTESLRLVKTADEINAIKSASLSHLADRRIEVVRG